MKEIELTPKAEEDLEAIWKQSGTTASDSSGLFRRMRILGV